MNEHDESLAEAYNLPKSSQKCLIFLVVTNSRRHFSWVELSKLCCLSCWAALRSRLPPIEIFKSTELRKGNTISKIIQEQEIKSWPLCLFIVGQVVFFKFIKKLKSVLKTISSQHFCDLPAHVKMKNVFVCLKVL